MIGGHTIILLDYAVRFALIFEHKEAPERCCGNDDRSSHMNFCKKHNCMVCLLIRQVRR